MATFTKSALKFIERQKSQSEGHANTDVWTYECFVIHCILQCIS